MELAAVFCRFLQVSVIRSLEGWGQGQLKEEVKTLNKTFKKKVNWELSMASHCGGLGTERAAFPGYVPKPFYNLEETLPS